MKKIAILLGALAVSFNAQAGIEQLNSALTNTIHASTNKHAISNPFAIVYGGKDFSHPQMAIAHESIWPTHSTKWLG